MVEYLTFRGKGDERPHWRRSCKSCRLAEQRRKWHLPVPEPKIPPEHRNCQDCGGDMTPALQARVSKIRCRTCQQKFRRRKYRLDHGLPVDVPIRRTSAEVAAAKAAALAAKALQPPRLPRAPKPVKAAPVKVGPVKQIHFCRDCGKEEVPAAKKLCRECLTAQYIRGDQRHAERLAKSRAVRGNRPGAVVDGRFFLYGSKCVCYDGKRCGGHEGLCNKPIILPGKCYSCGTKQPRTLLRAEERHAESA